MKHDRAPVFPARRLGRPLAALWISAALHAALIGLVQLAPPRSGGAGPVIEARLVVAPSPEAADTESVSPADTRDEAGNAASPSPPDAAAEAAASGRLPPGPASLPGAGIDVPVDLTYYTSREVDVQPRPLAPIDPVYPIEAETRRQSGKVRLQLRLEADGRVSAVDVVSAEPPGVFEAAAVKAFREARFVPGQRAGRPVRVQMLIEVTFDWASQPNPGGPL